MSFANRLFLAELLLYPLSRKNLLVRPCALLCFPLFRVLDLLLLLFFFQCPSHLSPDAWWR